MSLLRSYAWLVAGACSWVVAGAAWAGTPLEDFVENARVKHGDAGLRAARFLVEHMPSKDRESLSAEFLGTHLDLAFRARAEFPWAAQVPEEIFLNDVLPYAVFDETREPWRGEFLELGRELVKGAKSGSEAAQALNRGLFHRINVHYNTGRKRPNQSPSESRALSKATCTGLSIILVDACRAVGIPARAVGTPMWTNERGNHTWVEIWDGDWHFTGADEPDPAGLNRGWFVGDASKAKADVPRYSIYATSWKREGTHFPMVWARASQEVAAVNVTARYARPTAEAVEAGERTKLGVRLFDHPGGSRLVAHVCVMDPGGRTLAAAETKAGTADLNDMPRLDLDPGTTGRLRFAVGDEVRELALGPVAKGEPTVDAHWDKLEPVSPAMRALEAWIAMPVGERKADAAGMSLPLSKAEAVRATELLMTERRQRLAVERREEMEQRSIRHGERVMRWTSRTFGEAPAGQRSLWISMHGGGNAPARVNDQQWKNQSALYEPKEGIYVAPRAPTDTWNLWHEGHIDPMFQRLIEDHVVLAGVDPERVYLMGYSAGGDGVWQLAPRMADRFAAAAMMAGHPNEASLLGLRNLPFALFVGGSDGAYNRNKVVAERAAELDRLQKEDPEGYPHFARVYEGLPHWMNRRDAEALPWMGEYRRRTWPTRVVWVQDDVVHRRFYWLRVPEGVAIRDRAKVVGSVSGQTVRVDGEVPDRISLGLSDALVDLDRPVEVWVNGRLEYRGVAKRTAGSVWASLEERADPTAAATALLTVDLGVVSATR